MDGLEEKKYEFLKENISGASLPFIMKVKVPNRAKVTGKNRQHRARSKPQSNIFHKLKFKYKRLSPACHSLCAFGDPPRQATPPPVKVLPIPMVMMMVIMVVVALGDNQFFKKMNNFQIF